MRWSLVILLLLLSHGSDAFNLIPGSTLRAPPKLLGVSQTSRRHNSLPRASPANVKMVISGELVFPAMALACLSPTLLGLWKTEYTVSYGEFRVCYLATVILH